MHKIKYKYVNIIYSFNGNTSLFFLPETLIQMGQDPNKHSGGATRQSV